MDFHEEVTALIIEDEDGNRTEVPVESVELTIDGERLNAELKDSKRYQKARGRGV
jgi:hypothetical protein